MKKKIIIIAVVLLIVTALVITNKKETKLDNGKPTVKIGISLPLTGDIGYIGDSSKAAALMAFDKWQNESTKYNYELVFEDDKIEPKTIAMVGNKLLNLDNVDAILSIYDISGNILSALAANKEKIYMGCAWGKEFLNNEYSFNHYTPLEDLADELISILVEKDVKSFGSLIAQTKGNIELVNLISAKAKAKGIEYLYEKSFNFDEKDYRMMLYSIQDNPGDIIYVSNYAGGPLEILTKQIKEVGIKTPLTTIDNFAETGNKEMFEGEEFVVASYGTEEFKKEFSKTNKSVEACTANLYDMVDLLIYGFENTDSEIGTKPRNIDVVSTLHSIKDYDGAVENISIRDNGQIITTPYKAVIENGKVKYLK